MSESIAIVVNDGAISRSDVDDRINLIIRSSGLQDNAAMRERVRAQVLNILIEEEIKLQEAERLDIEVTEEERDAAFENLAKSNNLNSEQFLKVLKRSGVNIQTLYRQIRAEIAWTKVVQREVRPRVNVRDTDVDAAIERLNENVGKVEYRVAEIFLPVEKPEDNKGVQQLANRLSNDIKAGQAPFPKVAQQFSKSAGARSGGEMGWVQQGQIDEELENALQTMTVKSVSQPIRTLSGYHILYLINRREIKAENIPGAAMMTNTLGAQRLERLARRYLMDLKSSAFIDNRV